MSAQQMQVVPRRRRLAQGLLARRPVRCLRYSRRRLSRCQRSANYQLLSPAKRSLDHQGGRRSRVKDRRSKSLIRLGLAQLRRSQWLGWSDHLRGSELYLYLQAPARRRRGPIAIRMAARQSSRRVACRARGEHLFAVALLRTLAPQRDWPPWIRQWSAQSPSVGRRRLLAVVR